MESNNRITDVLLLEHYNEESEMLHKSFRMAGFSGPVIVIDDDGFLPEDVISVYQYFCGDFKNSNSVPGNPRYFNQINVPDFWEISGNNNLGKICDMECERGRIFYAEPKHKRLVRIVDWLDEKGTARSSDHYNRYGALYARTFFNKDGKRFCKAYFDSEGREVLVDNFVTNDIILNRNGKVYVLKNKTELTIKVFEELGITKSRIFYNTLSIPLFVSERLPEIEKGDVLFWQEGARNDIPGNMRLILDGHSKRTKTIYVQKRESYDKLIELGVPKDSISLMGYTYDFMRQNKYKNEALICTNSDQIEQCEELIKGIPQLHFHIAALTEMSSKLLALSQYENVSLYPGVRSTILDELFDSCDYYLDINYGSEIVSAIKQAFIHNQLIVGFKQTLHNKAFIAPDHIFGNREELILFLKSMMGNGQMIETHLNMQRKVAMSEEKNVYADLLK